MFLIVHCIVQVTRHVRRVSRICGLRDTASAAAAGLRRVAGETAQVGRRRGEHDQGGVQQNETGKTRSFRRIKYYK